MIILTDTPQWLLELPMCLKECSGEWTDLGSGDLDRFQQELWMELGTGDRLWRGQIDAEDPIGFWDVLVVVDEAPRSQFDVLKKMSSAHQKWPANVVCVAVTGNGFHGHRGRTWQTERGNLHLSAACHLGVDAQKCGLSLTALPAVVVMDALAEHGGWSTAPGIKWVNDILMAGCKVGGVLAATQSLRQTITSLTVGIGLNVSRVPEGFVPDLFVPAAGCLADFSRGRITPTVGDILERSLRHLSERLVQIGEVGPEPMLAEYSKHSLAIGRNVIILEDLAHAGSDPTLLAEGRVIGIGPDLSLTLEGHQDPLARGRLIFSDPLPGPSSPDGETIS